MKIGVKKAGEAGLNITEEDLMRIYSVADVMDKEVPVIKSDISLSELINIVSNSNYYYYPVVDNDDRLIGAVTLDGIRNTFATQELNSWLIALDVTEPVVTRLTAKIRLPDALEQIKKFDTEYAPVIDPSQDDKFLGVLSVNAVQRKLSAEVVAKQLEADSMYVHGRG